MCLVCKELHGKTPDEALGMLEGLNLPSGKNGDTRPHRIATGQPQAQNPHRSTVETVLRWMRDRGVERVDLLSKSDGEVK